MISREKQSKMSLRNVCKNILMAYHAMQCDAKWPIDNIRIHSDTCHLWNVLSYASTTAPYNFFRIKDGHT